MFSLVNGWWWWWWCWWYVLAQEGPHIPPKKSGILLIFFWGEWGLWLHTCYLCCGHLVLGRGGEGVVGTLAAGGCFLCYIFFSGDLVVVVVVGCGDSVIPFPTPPPSPNGILYGVG